MWTVLYDGHPLNLSTDEYAALHRAAWDSPVEAERLARQHLRRSL